MLFSSILAAIVAVQHILFLILEMFLWDKPLGLRVFAQNLEKARATKRLAMNQGLYNGFLAAGLVWGLLLKDNGHSVLIFFLGCVVVAGVFGGFTVNKRIMLIQALPATVAIIPLLA